jgi:hypothetical protein
LTAALVAGCDSGRPRFKSTDITGADYGKTLELTDHTGRPRRLEDFRGKAVVVFFGFTHCPDVCPTTLADFASAVKRLGADADRERVAYRAQHVVAAQKEKKVAERRRERRQLVRLGTQSAAQQTAHYAIVGSKGGTILWGQGAGSFSPSWSPW